jgi:hypothetical protein
VDVGLFVVLVVLWDLDIQVEGYHIVVLNQAEASRYVFLEPAWTGFHAEFGGRMSYMFPHAAADADDLPYEFGLIHARRTHI